MLRQSEIRVLIEREGHTAVAESIRVVLAHVREEVGSGRLDEKSLDLALGGLPATEERQLLQSLSYSLQPLVNATGVILHTNLGRAPLAAAAFDHIRATAGTYSNLEFDLSTGERGKRDIHVDRLFQKLLANDRVETGLSRASPITKMPSTTAHASCSACIVRTSKSLVLPNNLRSTNWSRSPAAANFLWWKTWAAAHYSICGPSESSASPACSIACVPELM